MILLLQTFQFSLCASNKVPSLLVFFLPLTSRLELLQQQLCAEHMLPSCTRPKHRSLIWKGQASGISLPSPTASSRILSTAISRHTSQACSHAQIQPSCYSSVRGAKNIVENSQNSFIDFFDPWIRNRRFHSTRVYDSFLKHAVLSSFVLFTCSCFRRLSHIWTLKTQPRTILESRSYQETYSIQRQKCTV